MIRRGLFLFSEAPVDPADEQISEPTEEDIAVKSDSTKDATPPGTEETDDTTADDTDGGDADTGLDGDDGSDGSNDEDPMGDGGDDSAMDDATADPAAGQSNEEKAKRYRVMKDYERLLATTEDLKESLSRMNVSDMTDRERAIFVELDRSLADSIEKLEYVMVTAYPGFEYTKLLTVYQYLKTNVKVVSEILQKLVKL